MGFGRYTFALNSALCFLLAYFSAFSSENLFGYALVDDPAARILCAVFFFVGFISLTSVFETSIVRVYSAKILAIFHLSLLIANFYNFLTSSVPAIAFTIHSLFFVALIILIFRGPGKFE